MARASLGSDRVAVITGASAGIGKATAIKLAQQGWAVIGVGRDAERSATAEAEVRAASKAAKAHFLRGDFAEMREVRRVAQEIAHLTNRIDLLINNAGGVRDRRYQTAEGNEATFAANHLAPFVLTQALLRQLRAAASASPPGAVRVIAVSSSGHERCEAMKWGDLNMVEGFKTGTAYCQAKLANILFTRELGRRLAPEGIVAQAMHPGVVASNFASHGDDFMQKYMGSLDDALSPDTPAETLVWMATAPEAGAPSGRYFHDRAEVQPAPQALDDQAARRLWNDTETILAKQNCQESDDGEKCHA